MKIPRGQVDSTTRINIGFYCPRVHGVFYEKAGWGGSSIEGDRKWQ